MIENYGIPPKAINSILSKGNIEFDVQDVSIRTGAPMYKSKRKEPVIQLKVPGGKTYTFKEGGDANDIQVQMLEFIKEYKQKGFGSQTAKPGAKLLD